MSAVALWIDDVRFHFRAVAGEQTNPAELEISGHGLHPRITQSFIDLCANFVVFIGRWFVQARLTLDEAWRMTDELIAAEREWLPAWLDGDVPDWLG